MRIEKLTLKNCGRHADLTFDCDGTVVGLLGANSSGKSTCLTMLEFAFTGETGDPINTYVRNYEGNAVVTCTFIKNGKRGEIMRQFGSTPKRKLTWDGKTFTLVKEVDAVLSEIFGADKRAVANAVFIQQGTMEQILFDDEGDRKKSFIKLVNLSYCAARATVVDGKIKRIKGTVVDLVPARDAALEQRRIATENLEREKAAASILKDYTEELAHIQKLDHATSQVSGLQVQIDRIENEVIVTQQQMLSNLKDAGVSDAQFLAAHIAKAETEEAQLAESLTEIQSVSGELTHYDRLSREIQELFDTNKSLDAEELQINPEKKTVAEMEPAKARISTRLEQWERYDTLHRDWKSEAEKLHLEQTNLGQLLPPAMTESEAISLRTKQMELSGDRHLFKTTLITRQEIAKCVVVTPGQPATCPDCGLTIQNPEDVGPEALALLEQRIVTLTSSIDAAEAQLGNYAKSKSDYDTAKNQVEGRISGHLIRIAYIKNELGTLPVPEAGADKAALKAEFEQLVGVCQRLPQIQKERGKNMMGIMTRTTSRGAYTRALRAITANQREAYSQAMILQKSQQKRAAGAELQTLRPFMATHNTRQNSLDEKKVQLSRLNNDQEKWRLETTVPMRESLLRLREEVAALPGMDTDATLGAALKAEVSARQAAYNAAGVRKTSAEEAYTQTNNRLHELEARMEKDKAKLELISDLTELRDLLLDDGLPMAVVRYQFEHLARLTQESLAKLNANFAIKIDRSKDLSFCFWRLDETSGIEHGMRKLSGGQRIRLAVAFLMAVQKRLVKDVGLLVLDEPTTHVDEAGIDQMVEFLREMQITLQSTDHQLFLVDHNPKMEMAMEKVLRLT